MAIENNPTASATLTNPYDINREGKVDATDQALAAASAAAGNALELITPTYIQPSPLPGDADLDGVVDAKDLTIVLSHYNQSGMTWSDGDFNGDGKVDIQDLDILLSHYGQSLPLPVVSPGTANAIFVQGSGRPVLAAPNLTLSDSKDAYMSSATVAIDGGPAGRGGGVSERGDGRHAHHGELQRRGRRADLERPRHRGRLPAGAAKRDLCRPGNYRDHWIPALDFAVRDPASLSATASTPVRVAAPLPGDANLDGTVNVNDLVILLAHYNQSGMTWSDGDFNGDGKVDIEDLNILLRRTTP